MRMCGCMRHACCCSDSRSACRRCQDPSCLRAPQTPSLQPLLCLHRRRSLSLSAAGLPERIVCILAVCMRPHRAGAMPHLPGRTGTVPTGALEGMLESSLDAWQNRSAGRAAWVRQLWHKQAATQVEAGRMTRPAPGQPLGIMQVASHGWVLLQAHCAQMDVGVHQAWLQESLLANLMWHRAFSSGSKLAVKHCSKGRGAPEPPLLYMRATWHKCG